MSQHLPASSPRASNHPVRHQHQHHRRYRRRLRLAAIQPGGSPRPPWSTGRRPNSPLDHARSAGGQQSQVPHRWPPESRAPRAEARALDSPGVLFWLFLANWVCPRPHALPGSSGSRSGLNAVAQPAPPQTCSSAQAPSQQQSPAAVIDRNAEANPLHAGAAPAAVVSRPAAAAAVAPALARRLRCAGWQQPAVPRALGVVCPEWKRQWQPQHGRCAVRAWRPAQRPGRRRNGGRRRHEPQDQGAVGGRGWLAWQANVTDERGAS